jgi:hypothetical protein
VNTAAALPYCQFELESRTAALRRMKKALSPGVAEHLRLPMPEAGAWDNITVHAFAPVHARKWTWW